MLRTHPPPGRGDPRQRVRGGGRALDESRLSVLRAHSPPGRGDPRQRVREGGRALDESRLSVLRSQRSQPRGPTLLTSTSTCTTSTDRIGEARWRPAPTGCGTRTARRLPKTGHCATLRDAALSAFMRDPGHARRGRSGRAPTGGWGRTPGAACWARRAGRRTRGTARQARNKWCREDVLPRRRGPPLAPRSPPARPPLRELPKQRPAWSSTIRAGSFETLLPPSAFPAVGFGRWAVLDGRPDFSAVVEEVCRQVLPHRCQGPFAAACLHCFLPGLEPQAQAFDLKGGAS